VQKGSVAVQIDFGNLAVGMATAGVALVTLYISKGNNNSTLSAKRAEIEWSDLNKMRESLAEFESIAFSNIEDYSRETIIKLNFHKSLAFSVMYHEKEESRLLRLSMERVIGSRVYSREIHNEFLRTKSPCLRAHWDLIATRLK
jgi:hypothetical protein